MRAYIIITPELTSMGGAQMYTANKVQYFKKHGWEVHVFYSMKNGSVLIPSLMEFERNYIPDLALFYPFLSKRKKKNICLQIKKIVGTTSDVIVESQMISQSFISEDIAKYIGARHIINSLEERTLNYTQRRCSYLEYKLKRWEFMNAGEIRLKNTFKKYYKEEFLQYENRGFFACSNVISMEEKDYGFAKADFTIISIGRLDKPYILPMVEEISKFSNRNNKSQINVILVGGSYDGTVEPVIKSKLNKIDNVHLYLLGYLYPIPINLIRCADVAIASANAVLVTAEQDIPTIVMDTHDSQAIGVFGYTTQNKFLRTTEPVVSCSELLDSILIDHKYPPRGYASSTNSDINSLFDREIEFLRRSDNNTGYYEMNKLYSLVEKCKYKVMWLYFSFFERERLSIK